jgi:hypothetical protein
MLQHAGERSLIIGRAKSDSNRFEKGVHDGTTERSVTYRGLRPYCLVSLEDLLKEAVHALSLSAYPHELGANKSC